MNNLSLIEPYGGELKNLIRGEADTAERKKFAYRLPAITLNQRQLCDLELLLNGGFSPLEGFMNRDDYENVVQTMRLSDGTLWPIPIVLDIPERLLPVVRTHQQVGLYTTEGLLLAIVEVCDIWKPDKAVEAREVYGTTNTEHPGVAYLFNQTNEWYIGGRVIGFSLPEHYDFLDLRMTPMQLREHFQRQKWDNIIAFQTRNPMHRAHQEITCRAMSQTGAKLLIHPVVGLTKPGDVDHCTRVKCYKQILTTYPERTAALSLLPLAMRMAGPREALWHAIIRRNYGCNHFIVGRDHAGPGNDGGGKAFYNPYDAQEIVTRHQADIGINIIKPKEMVYVTDKKYYLPIDEVANQSSIAKISGTVFRGMLQNGEEIPEWFSYPEVVRELRSIYPSKKEKGITIFFTGLSGAGKSTIANHLYAHLVEIGGRPATLLDGDIVRRYLSSELGFSKEHRDLNVMRVGFVASEITKNRGIAICALIAPYKDVRRQVRELVGQYGDFIEVYVSTPLTVCEQRDRKGLYAQARAGKISGFTGIDDPYEEPKHPEIVIDTTNFTPEESSAKVITYLTEAGYIAA